MLFFQLVNARYERASTVLTSNKGFEEWGNVLGDEVMAAALIDRLLHTATSSTSAATATGCATTRIFCVPPDGTTRDPGKARRDPDADPRCVADPGRYAPGIRHATRNEHECETTAASRPGQPEKCAISSRQKCAI